MDLFDSCSHIPPHSLHCVSLADLTFTVAVFTRFTTTMVNNIELNYLVCCLRGRKTICKTNWDAQGRIFQTETGSGSKNTTGLSGATL